MEVRCERAPLSCPLPTAATASSSSSSLLLLLLAPQLHDIPLGVAVHLLCGPAPGGASGGAWLVLRLGRRGSSSFFAQRAELPPGTYQGTLRVTTAGGSSEGGSGGGCYSYLHVPIPGLATVDKGLGDGGVNEIFHIPE